MKQLALFDNKAFNVLEDKNYTDIFIQSSNEDFSSYDKNKNGIFYTKNKCLIDKIIKNIILDDDLLQKKILEPSCGSGLLLVGLLEKAFEYRNDKGYIYNLINDVIYFNDIDSNMVNQTISNIKQLYFLFFNENYDGQFNCSSLDYTNKNNFTKIKFDYIIGNPPYVTLYGRRDKKQSEEQRQNILKSYKQFPKELQNGKINYVMLFIEQAIDMLDKNGNLTYIIDLAFFETAYLYTRKYILERTTINYIEYNIQGFDVASGQVIISLTNKETDGNNEIRIFNNENKTISHTKQKEWHNPADEYRFRLNLADTCLNNILNKINKKAPKTLKALYPNKNLRTCCMLLNLEQEFITKDSGLNTYPYYQGSKSIQDKYCTPNYRYHFHYNVEKQNLINDQLKIKLEQQGIKNKKRIGFGERIIYDNPKVYVRQSSKELIATYDSNKSCANNSLYVFTLRDNSKCSTDYLKFICGLFNTKLMTFLAQQRNIIRYFKGKQPQIKIGDLYNINIPENKELESKIARIVDEIYCNSYSKKTSYMEEIDSLIYDFYNINAEEINYIETKIKDFVSN